MYIAVLIWQQWWASKGWTTGSTTRHIWYYLKLETIVDICLFNEFISQCKRKYNNMREDYWPNGHHRIQPLTCGQYSKI